MQITDRNGFGAGICFPFCSVADEQPTLYAMVANWCFLQWQAVVFSYTVAVMVATRESTGFSECGVCVSVSRWVVGKVKAG